jgi:zinc protease
LIRENFDNPTVVIDGYLEAGSEDETPEQAGLANFTTAVMERATERRSFAQLYEEVESIGASFGMSSSVHTTSFGAKGLSEHLPLLLDILSDVMRHPAFPADQIEKERSEFMIDFEERAFDTRRMAGMTFYEQAYPQEHPYHRSTSGYPETIAPLTRDDMVAFHQKYFAPRGMTLVVVGAVKAQEAVKQITDIFGGWDATRPERAPLPAAPALTEIRRQTVAIPEKTQADLMLGWPGPTRRSPDFTHVNLSNTILGIFGMMGRLGETVREKNGLAYYAYSRVDGGRGPGPWRVIAGVNPANVDRAVGLILDEIRRARDEKFTEEEIAESKAFMIGSLPLQLETNEGIAGALINIERYELGLDYLRRYRQMLEAVTAEQMQTATQRWLDPDHYALAVAGPE